MPNDPPITTSEALTEGLRVAVRARYSAAHSDPQAGNWFFVYTIRLSNEGSSKLKLLSRHWLINDSTGRAEEVRGPGVIGEQPELDPGEEFEYTSGCPLPTPFGSMQGRYEIAREDGSTFEAEIAKFELREPRALH
jgi:ApaG protein